MSDPVVNPEAIQCKVSGDFHKSIPMCRVGGRYYNPKQVYVKVSGVWHLCYTQFVWTYSWVIGDWSNCGAVGTYQTRSVNCTRSPDNAIVNDNFCTEQKPISSQICNCNCACACC